MRRDPPQTVEFSVHVADLRDGGRAVTVFGELDMATAPRVRAAIEQAIETEGKLLIDLRACGFVDSPGIAVLAAAAWRRKEQGRVLAIRGLQERVRRTFDLAGLTSQDSVVIESHVPDA
jgi:anti-sigma B factor antagonist